jgi:ABC-type transport system involved in cytochrome c biogenesis ATPase subunit
VKSTLGPSTRSDCVRKRLDFTTIHLTARAKHLQNVLWNDLTVLEHVQIWNKIKCPGDDKDILQKLIDDCDLTIKTNKKAKTLSGGQKRKLQLALMFTGGSRVCAVDEISSGLVCLLVTKLPTCLTMAGSYIASQDLGHSSCRTTSKVLYYYNSVP